MRVGLKQIQKISATAVAAAIAVVVSAIVLVSATAAANVRVAFLEVYNSQGKLVQYAPGGRFGHSAIQMDPTSDLWLQSYPGEGVKFITMQELKARGKIAAMLEIPVDVSPTQVTAFIGRPFDFNYSWSDDAFYCSELLAKILQIPTEPMHFNHEAWPKSYWSKEGQPGLSPDGAYRYLKQKYSL